jgi:trimeric autotransporter adhesin
LRTDPNVRRSIWCRIEGEIMATITGTGGNDTLTGTSMDDTIQGLAGDDTLHGGAGGDTMFGGTGNDTYFIENPLDRVFENAGSGFDVVNSFVTFGLPPNVEALALQGSGVINGDGNELDNFMLGNAAANVLNGGNGDDVLDGFLGSDTLTGSNGNDTLLGGEGNDTVLGSDNDDLLIGGSGKDFLNGGNGVDTMEGGTGDDIYNMLTDGIDVVIENASEGNDRVNTAFSITLAANVEILVMFGTDAINGTGNKLLNTMTGNESDNSISGLSGDDSLFGHGGNDVLDGGSGADSMHGGSGNDTFIVGNAADVVSENLNEGFDRIDSSVSFTLGFSQSIEVLQLVGTGNTDATGNEVAQTLTGNSGSNRIASGSANDEMFAAAENDTFVYRLGDGDDLVGDFQGAGLTLGDIVELQATGITNFTDLMAATVDVVGGCEITFAAGQQLSFRDVSKAQLDASDFVFA